MQVAIRKKYIEVVLAIFRLAAPHERYQSWQQSMAIDSLNASRSFVFYLIGDKNKVLLTIAEGDMIFDIWRPEEKTASLKFYDKLPSATIFSSHFSTMNQNTSCVFFHLRKSSRLSMLDLWPHGGSTIPIMNYTVLIIIS